MATNGSNATAGMQSPLFRLPGEIRNQIYRLVVLSTDGSDTINLSSGYRTYEAEGPSASRVALLQTSRQICAEASSILYEKTYFHYALDESHGLDAHCQTPFKFPRNFRLVRILDIQLYVEGSRYLSHSLKRLLEFFIAQNCQLEKVLFRYWLPNANFLETFEDFSSIAEAVKGSSELLATINVQKKIDFFFCRHSLLFDSTEGLVQDIAARKDWAAFKFHEDVAVNNEGEVWGDVGWRVQPKGAPADFEVLRCWPERYRV